MFGDFLQPTVKVWRAGEPYAVLIYDILEYKTDLILSYTNLPKVHLGLSVFTRGYSSELDMEVKIMHNTLHSSAEEDDEIVMAFGFPFFPIGHPWVSFVPDFFCIFFIINLLWTIKPP